MSQFLKVLLIICLLFPNISFSKNIQFNKFNLNDIGNGIWIHINTFSNSSQKEIIDLCKFFLNRNIKNVFILAKDINGELLYKKYENTLLRIVGIFKKYQINVHYYIPIGYDPKFLKENQSEASLHSPDKNNPFPYPDKELKVVNLNSKKYINYIKTIVKELIYYYEADGIQLDYIRYPNVYYGYDDYVKNNFISRGGNWNRVLEIFIKNIDIFSLYDNKDKDVILLADIRSEVITNFSNEIKSFISSISKEILFSVTLIQSGSSFLSYREGGKDSFPYGFLHFGQDYKKLSEISDFVSPLAYHKNYEKDIEWVREIIKNTKKKVSSKILCGIQANDTHENLEKLMKICEEERVNFSLFRLGTFLPVKINLKNIDALKYQIDFTIFENFYEYTKKYNFDLKINEINLTKSINIKDKLMFTADKGEITIFLKGIPLLTDKVKFRIFNTVKFKIGDKNYFVDGIKKSMDASPFLFNGRTMVPVRVISETLGYEVIWKDGEVILKNKNLTINLYVNKNKIVINDLEIFIDSYPIIKEGRTYLPIRYMCEILNLLVSWFDKEKEVIIEGFINEEEEKLLLYRENINNLTRELVSNKTKMVILSNEIDITSLIMIDKEFLLRGIKIYFIYNENLTQYKNKLLSLDGFLIDEKNSYSLLKGESVYRVFDSSKLFPKDALLSFADFRFKEKVEFYIFITDKYFIELFKPYVEKDKNFLGFILKENS